MFSAQSSSTLSDPQEVRVGPGDNKVEVLRQAEAPHLARRFGFLWTYLARLKGAGQPRPEAPKLVWDAIPSFLFSSIAMLVLAVIEYFGLRPYNKGLFSYVPASAATCALVMCQTTNPGAQPRSLFLTHLCASFLGVSWGHITHSLPNPLGEQLASAFAVGMLAPFLFVTGMVQHSASITACLGAFHTYGEMNDQGYMFIVVGALLTSAVLSFLGWVLNNLVPWRPCYPLWL